MEKNYQNEYKELFEKYNELKEENKILNQELYYIRTSRSYKLSLLIKKAYEPFRNGKILSHKDFIKRKKINDFISGAQNLAIVPCSFEFDEFVNQRPINYAKYLADSGYKVIYLAWQWDESTKISNSFKIVYKNVLQVPIYDFFKIDCQFNNKINNKIFYINFPHECFAKYMYDLRAKGFLIHYDIMDEWEEFKKVDQAVWYKRPFEEKIILESDFVSAVSPYLVDKFSYLRSDIALSPNGFYKNVTGISNKNIALKQVENGLINIGYFGHLTESWFNWDLLLKIAKKNKNYIFHLIGYGLSDEILEKIKKYDNIKFYGKVPTSMLCNYVKNWNIGIILFKEFNLSKAVDPIKIYEYLYMGLPVISSGIEHLKNYPNTFYVRNEAEFCETVSKILENKTHIDIDEFLEESTWESRFSKFLVEYNNKGMSSFYEN